MGNSAGIFIATVCGSEQEALDTEVNILFLLVSSPETGITTAGIKNRRIHTTAPKILQLEAGALISQVGLGADSRKRY